ncbi:MAG: broad specificity phosphatase PhoE [Mariniblastus sp.]|jgi:broad specificity phosphatase PhoE
MNIFGNTSKLNFLLVRAGSTDLDDQGRIVGALDMPLSLSGEEEARETADELEEVEITAIYTAACLAAQQTGQQLSRNGEIKVRVQESWINLNHGLWHGKSLDELKEMQPKLYRKWLENPESVCPPGGETVEDVRTRVKVVLKKICRKFRSGTVAIVAPDPLFGIIRAEIEHSAIRDLQPQPESIRWEEIAFRGAVV